MRKLTFAVASFLSVCSATTRAQSEPEGPWGYLYAVRTMHLYELVAEESTIGRRTSNDIILTSPRVSREHAAIRRTETSVELVDVGSSNGSKLNGKALRPHVPVPLEPGARIQLADELLLYDSSLDALWLSELRSRLLTSIVRLSLHLPQDETRRSFGHDEIVPAVTEAKLGAQSGVEDVVHSVTLDPGRGFPKDGGAFIGNVEIVDQTLELSLWTVARTESMTGRRASLSNLKHTTLRISPAEGSEEEMTQGPWFPPQYLSTVFDIFPEEPDFVLRFCDSLASQERTVALRDAATSLYYRHSLDPDEWKLLLQATHSAGLWVEKEISEKRNRLSARERAHLAEALTKASSELTDARSLGASDDEAEVVAKLLAGATEQLKGLEAR